MEIKFFDNNGIYNAYVEVNNEKYRVRSEVLILKNKKVYLKKSKEMNQYFRNYKIPGGSIEPNYGIIKTAEKEAKEESRIIIKDCHCINLSKPIIKKYEKIPEWHKTILWKNGFKYAGYVTFVCVAKYHDRYNGYIKKEDQEEEMLKGKWYDYLNDNSIIEEHKKAIELYIKNYSPEKL